MSVGFHRVRHRFARQPLHVIRTVDAVALRYQTLVFSSIELICGWSLAAP